MNSLMGLAGLKRSAAALFDTGNLVPELRVKIEVPILCSSDLSFTGNYSRVISSVGKITHIKFFAN